MKKVLFATTAASTLLIGGIASAQGIALFGDARLGLGYNIDNDGGVLVEENDDGTLDTPDDLRAVSRVRFGVNMTGETDSGITFGATIRADNAAGGQGGTEGQRSGSVFVSGSFGTLTYGDTNALRLQWRRLRLGQRRELRQQPVRPADRPLRLRHHGLRHLGVVEP
jgi:outer membrane protein OmpU